MHTEKIKNCSLATLTIDEQLCRNLKKNQQIKVNGIQQAENFSHYRVHFKGKCLKGFNHKSNNQYFIITKRYVAERCFKCKKDEKNTYVGSLEYPAKSPLLSLAMNNTEQKLKIT